MLYICNCVLIIYIKIIILKTALFISTISVEYTCIQRDRSKIKIGGALYLNTAENTIFFNCFIEIALHNYKFM